MIVEAEALPAAMPLAADLCVIGAGPAGIAIALEAADRGLAVMLLESGGAGAEAASEALNAGEVSGAHPPAAAFRRRRLGGATAIWGGRCAKLDPIDFAPRPWLGLPGWPIAAAELSPYWPRAAAWAEIGSDDFDAATAVPGGMRPMIDGFEDNAISMAHIERFSPPTRFGSAHRARLSRHTSLTLVLHATCQEIVLTPSGRAVDHLRYVDRAGHSRRLRARDYVVAAGGIETARLLLASRSVLTQGIGNAWDQVGRHYMCHVAGTLGVFAPSPGQRVFHGYERAPGGVYCRRRLSVRPAAQRAARMGNAIARLHHPRIADPAHGSGALSALWCARALLPREYAWRIDAAPHAWAGHGRNLFQDAPGAAAFAWRMLTQRLAAHRKLPSVVVAPPAGVYVLDLHAEQLPDPTNRVSLGAATDRCGMPVPHIAWHWTHADLVTVQGTLALIAAAFARGGHGTLLWDAAETVSALTRDGAYGGHHLGTARMGVSARDGVVDSDCRVFGVANLFVAGGAVFPTSGQANPTLAILALSLRLADHLCAQQGRLQIAPGASVIQSAFA